MEEDLSVSVGGACIPDEEALVDLVRGAIEQGSKKINIINGFVVNTDSSVRVLTGPIVGEVTDSSAVILLEVTKNDAAFVQLSFALYADEDKDDPAQVQELEVKVKRPFTVKFEELTPCTRYILVIHGICKFNTVGRMVTFRTKPQDISSFRLFALSCDRPSRLLLGQQDPWAHMLKRHANVDVVLHLGDQIYPDNEDIAHADSIFSEIFDGLPEEKQKVMMARGLELWRNKYRTVFSRDAKGDLMSKVSNLMIWSDNDVANDFTTMKNAEGLQKYHPNFLKCGMMAYREYQRRLWDPECDVSVVDEVAEWHSHIYGPIGIFMFDLRGNRIDCDGNQMSENNLLSDGQWEALEEFFQNPDLRMMILVSETPFVGDEPEVCREKVEQDSGMDFLRDHWPFNDDELIRLMDLCFSWKAAGEESGIGREVLLLAGDIHCGVTTVVRDEETGLQINQLTTSPVTNHVCNFYPGLQGNISHRYNYSHLPLGKKFRNYADISVQIADDDVHLQAKLVPISTDIFKDFAWCPEEDEE